MSWIFICLGIGTISGILAGLCGVGGGVVIVPALLFWLKMPQREAVATSLVVILLTAAIASIRNAGNQLVDWKVAIVTGLAAGLLAWFAADWLKHLSNLLLTRLFACLLIGVGVRMLFVR